MPSRRTLFSLLLLVASQGCASYTGPDSEQEYQPVPNEQIEASMVVFYGEDNSSLGGGNTIVGDLDGDGIDDLVLVDGGAEAEAKIYEDVNGAAYIFYGREVFKRETRVVDADAILRGVSTHATAFCDFDGDGLHDLAFNGECKYPGVTPEGYCMGFRLVYGSTERFSGQQMSTSVGVDITYPSQPGPGFESLGVTCAGDVNGDGLDDLLFETRTDSSSAYCRGHAYLLYGRQERLSGEFSLDDADAVFEGSGDGYYVQVGAKGAGDVDGDGYSDLLVPFEKEDTEPGYGRSIGLYYGGQSLIGRISPSDSDARINLDFIWVQLVGLGDLDGDGADDFGTTGQWDAVVIYGSAERFSGVLTDDDVDFVIKPEGAPSYLAALASGDVDSDGQLDLLVGDPQQNAEGMQSGALYLLLGESARFSGRSSLGRSNALLYGKGSQEAQGGLGESLGYGTASGGDVNGDGYQDVLVGAIGNIIGDEFGGAVYLIFGGPSKE